MPTRSSKCCATPSILFPAALALALGAPDPNNRHDIRVRINSNVGPGALVAGDRFRLFVATGYFGAFTNVVLPPLDPGLDWENSLTGDGSIGVIVASQPGFAGLLLTGTNLVFSGTNGTPGASYAVLTATNVTLPLSNWVSLVTNQFSASGQFTFTNGIAPTDPQRYFRLRTP